MLLCIHILQNIWINVCIQHRNLKILLELVHILPVLFNAVSLNTQQKS